MIPNKLYVIDYDRTLGDVGQVMILAGKTCEAVGIDFSKIKTEAQNASAAATPYSPLDTIAEEGEEKAKDFKRKFLELAESDKLVYPDGWRYLDRLRAAGEQYMILTHAVDKQWQELKLAASGLDNIPHIITFNPNKSEDIAGWVDKEGHFAPPLSGITPSEQIVFVDDRLRAFLDLPPNCRGFFINRTHKEVEKHDLPPAVIEINSFDEIIDKI